MARATWSGAISFGLVSVPVQLFTAVRRHSVRFRQLHQETGAPIEQQRVDSSTGEQVPYDEVVKGYEVEDGRYLVVDPDELRALDPEGSRRIEIHDFVDESGIDPVFYDRPYHLSPDGEAATKPYRLLVEAMARTGKVAIATFVMRNTSYLAAIRSREGVLVLSTMHYGDEVADPQDLGVDELLDAVAVDEREIEMAEQLIGSLSTSFDPARYRDEHRERLESFLEAKAEGQHVTLPEPGEDAGEVVDLVAALERSLERARGGSDRDAAATRGGDGAVAAYEGMTRDELYELAQQRELPGRSQMSKAELAEALRTSDRSTGAA